MIYISNEMIIFSNAMQLSEDETNLVTSGIGDCGSVYDSNWNCVMLACGNFYGN